MFTLTDYKKMMIAILDKEVWRVCRISWCW